MLLGSKGCEYACGQGELDAQIIREARERASERRRAEPASSYHYRGSAAVESSAFSLHRTARPIWGVARVLPSVCACVVERRTPRGQAVSRESRFNASTNNENVCQCARACAAASLSRSSRRS